MSIYKENFCIRTRLGHGEGNRIVRVHHDGMVEYYGSRDPVDRQHDWWHYAGERADLLKDALEIRE